MSDIWKVRGELEKARRDFQRAAMAGFDRDIYWPSMIDLRATCLRTTGHRPTGHHDNGLGWTWQYCGDCGTRVNIEGPEGQTERPE